MNLPTKITLFRIVIVPFLWLILLLNIDQNLKLWLALILFVVASISDFLDGYIARKYNLVTSLGKFLDPIADKVLVNSLLIYLTTVNIIPLICVLIMVVRDILVDALRMNASEKQIVVAAMFLGKLKTVLQMIAITFALIPNMSQHLILVLIIMATTISFMSGVQYFHALKDKIF